MYNKIIDIFQRYVNDSNSPINDYTDGMRRIIFLIINLILLAIAIASGAFLLIGLLALATGVIAYLYVKQKITGKRPDIFGFSRFVDMSQPSAPQKDTSQIIDVEYHVVNSDEKITYEQR
jgi:hypothetical protein